MYQSINFKDGSFKMLSDEEKTLVNHHLLNGENFVEVVRLNKTFNKDIISFVGENTLFKLPEVRSIPKENFGFTKSNVFAVDGQNYWKYVGPAGWEVSNKEEFEKSSDFEGFIRDYNL